jgi:hypothetical protein
LPKNFGALFCAELAMQHFDFDYWMNLFALSPMEFEVQRRAALQEMVDKAQPSHQVALAAMVETLCAPQQGSPLERALNAQTLMFESLAYLKAGWVVLAEETGEGSALECALLNAQVQIAPMAFPQRHDGPGKSEGHP